MKVLRGGFDAAINAVLPPRSLLTDKPLPAGGVEAELFDAIKFLDAPWCDICGFPFEYESGVMTECADCAASLPAFDRARAAFIYDDASRKLLLDFKHGGRTEGLSVFGVHLQRAGRDMLGGADMIVPVPLHWRRLARRKFNQSALLGRVLSARSGVPLKTGYLKRKRATETQGHKSLAGRQRNVQGAFALTQKGHHAVKDKHIVLLDDVYTTGSTVSACARTLKSGGARRVDVLTLARVVRTAASLT